MGKIRMGKILISISKRLGKTESSEDVVLVGWEMLRREKIGK